MNSWPCVEVRWALLSCLYSNEESRPIGIAEICPIKVAMEFKRFANVCQHLRNAHSELDSALSELIANAFAREHMERVEDARIVVRALHEEVDYMLLIAGRG